MKESLWDQIVRTGTALAILIGVQWLTGLTRPFADGYVADTCIDAVLLLIAAKLGLWPGGAVAVLAPLCAYVLKLDTGIIQAVPAIVVGNLTYCILGTALLGERPVRKLPCALSAGILAVCKFAALYCALIFVTVPVLGPNLSMEEEMLLRTAYGWPQKIAFGRRN